MEIYQQVDDFHFVDINEFEFVANIERSKSFVYLYKHSMTGDLVAVKEFRLSNYSKQEIDNKKKILKILQELNHDNIVQYRGLSKLVKKNQDVYHESFLIFMQYCERNLAELIAQRALKKEMFTLEQLKNMLDQLVDALSKLEKWGISHRDIKPQNILVKSNNKYKLCDFQDAILCATDFIDSGINITTVQYSPLSLFNELKYKKKKAYDPFKVDVYSLGLTVLVMCSLGKFQPSERLNHSDDHRSHKRLMKDTRNKYVKLKYESQFLNRIVKMMIEEDQYKRESFLTLKIKMDKLTNFQPYDESKSENSSNSESSTASRKEQFKIIKKGQKSDSKRFCLLCLLLVNLGVFIMVCAL